MGSLLDGDRSFSITKFLGAPNLTYIKKFKFLFFLPFFLTCMISIALTISAQHFKKKWGGDSMPPFFHFFLIPIFRAQLQGQNPLAWRVIYIIKKLLKRRCLKCARIAHLDTWNTSYEGKKGRESKKVGNQSDFLTFRRRATYCWKAFN